jgi:hypothetical protein
MAKLTSREELKQYSLRRLGEPVIQVNADDTQLEDRIDDAFQFYREYHFDAIEKVYLKHQITANNISQGYVEVSDAVVGVNAVLPFTNKTSGNALFSIQYQILINDLYSLMSTDIIYYTQVKRQIELLQQVLAGIKPVRFNRHANRIYIDMDWSVELDVGDFIVFEAYRILDPETYNDVYDDMFLKRYTTALFKRQWGENLKKFGGISLPGGTTLNGEAIYNEAMAEIAQIEQEMQGRFELPVDFFTG